MENHSKYVKYKKGPFPFPEKIKWINTLFHSYADRRFDAGELTESAIRSSKLDDFGNDFWKEPLSRLVEDINESTPFHAIGAFLYKMKILSNLRNRLWAQYWIKRYPEITTHSFPPVVLITGLQRTGTTFMQRLLGVLPEFRGLHSWELISPVATNKRGKGSFKSFAKLGHFIFNMVNPYFKTIHSVDYNSLEEEVVLMDHSFMSSVSEAVLHVPNYGLWLEEQDHTPAYEDLKMWLRLLLRRNPANQYLLQKSPHHMEYLDTYFEVFPDTRVIIIHRPIKESLASFCSMVYFGKMNFLKHADPTQIGQKWLRKNQILIDRFLNTKRKFPQQFMEFSYQSLVNDPVSIVREIYTNLDLEWSVQHEKLATGYVNSFHQNKFGKHSYELSDFGLSEELICSTFENYLQEYKGLIYEHV